jgi:hypothetical protein
MADDVYHVTFTKNLPDIQESGFDTSVKPLWAKGDPRYEGVLPPARTAYQESPSVFAFTNPKDALSWAWRMDETFGGKDLSIIRLKGGEHWTNDPSEDHRLTSQSRTRGEEGRSVLTERGISPEDIVSVSQIPAPAGVNPDTGEALNPEFREAMAKRFPEAPDQDLLDRWFDYYGEKLRGLPLDEPRSTDLTQIFRTGDPRKGEEQSIGQVPNQIDKLTGRFRTSLTPNQFRQLASPADFQPNTFLEESLRNQDAVAPPWLKLHWEPEKSAWKVIGHEGRNRADAAHNVFGDQAIPVDFFLRAKHPNSRSGGEIELDQLSPEMKQALENRRFISQEGVQVSEFPELTEEPRSTDLATLAPDLATLALPPEEDPSQKKPKQTGKAWRGIGSLMRKRMFPILQVAQQAWGTLSDDQKGQVTAFLNTPMHELVGMDKPGIDYFRQMLGMGPEQPEEGILSIPDLRKRLDFYHGTSNVWGAEEDYPLGRPRLDFMGTGEGAQVYAPGFYSGEERSVGVDYAEMLAQKYKTVPSLYKGKILESEASEKFIDYNLPVNEQSQTVQNAFKNLGYDYETKDENRLAGADIFELMKTVKGEDEAVEALRKEGVVGLRYLDKYSRQNQNLYKGKSIVRPSGEAVLMNEDWQQHAREILKHLVDENIDMEDFISQQREQIGSQNWFSRIFSGAKQEEKLLDVLEGTSVAKSPLTKNMVIWDQSLLDELGRTIEKEMAAGGFIDKPLYDRSL